MDDQRGVSRACVALVTEALLLVALLVGGQVGVDRLFAWGKWVALWCHFP